MPRTRCLAWGVAVVWLGLSASRSSAAVVVLGNWTEQEVHFTLSHEGHEPRAGTLALGESLPFPVGRHPVLTYTSGGQSRKLKLDPYAAYMFLREGDGMTVQGVELAGRMPKPDDVPDAPPSAVKTLRLPVKILADDAEPRVKAAWEKALRQRVAAASAILKRQCGVTIDVIAVDTWKSDPMAPDTPALLKDLEKKTKPAPATVAVGFSSRPFKPGEAKDSKLGCTRGPLYPYVLIREGRLRSDAEQLEVLVHEFAHLFGAAHTPDPISAMRSKLGDGKARSARFHIGLDPLNHLAVAIWTEELRTGKVHGWDDLRPKSRERLTVIYKTLQHALPEDPVAQEYLNLLQRAEPGGGAVAQAPKPNEQVRPPMPPKLSPEAARALAREEAIRKVVRAVAIRAADLNRLPADSPERPKGDKLTVEYVRAAASVALTQEEALQVPAFLLGLGIALDDSTILRTNPLTRDMCRAAENDEERRARVASLGVPTVRHRRDLCQHFAVSAALTELLGSTAAEAAGLAKELYDMQRPSGFSFTDLAADLAGIAFAQRVRGTPELLRVLQDRFQVEDFIPTVTGLREGLSARRFRADYGALDDPRFKTAMDEVRRRVEEMPAYKNK
jgi:hypothetical protein